MIRRIIAAVMAAATLFTAAPVTAQAKTKATVTTGSSVTVTTKKVYATAKLTKKKISLYPDAAKQLKVKWTKGDKSKLKWSVKNKRIAKVSKSGILTALYPGKTKVTVKAAKGKVSTATVTVKKPDTKKTVYLTFDDGPGSKVTPKLLDVLKKNHVKATFFIVGTQAKGHEAILRRIVREGHTLAIHTYTHDFKKIYRSPEAYLADFHKTEKLIKKATGVQPHYFRFPGGGNNGYSNRRIRNAVLKQLHKEGYTEMDWNAGTSDAASTYYDAATLIRNGKTSHWGNGPIVMLQHDWNAKYHTPQVTEALIKHYKSKGYRFANLDHYYGPELCFNYRR